MTTESPEGARPPMPPTQPPHQATPAQPVPPQPLPHNIQPPYAAAPGPAAPGPSSTGSPVMAYLMIAAGFTSMFVSMFVPLASNGDPASELRTTDLPFTAPMFGLVALALATPALRGNHWFLKFGRAVAPLLGLLLSAAAGGEIFQWGGRMGGPEVSLANMTGSGPYYLICGILLLSLSVLAVRPSAGQPAR